MTRRAYLFHGTDGNPNNFWFPSLKEAFQDAGYKVFAPVLPENHTPNRSVYEKFIREKNWIFDENSVLVGHSSGATTVLSLLQSDWFPAVGAGVLVATFLNEQYTKSADWYDEGQFDNLFPEYFDIDKIRSKCRRFYFVHGDNDPFCSYNTATEFSKKLGGMMIPIKHGHHLGGTSGITSLPELETILKQDGIL